MNGESPETLLIYCTCPDEAAAALLATSLVEQGLAACVNVLPRITSVYKWQGEVKTDTEALLMIKTAASRYSALESEILETHPYELPEIIAVSLDAGSPGYINWIRDETGT